jgi:hypothetical protein
MSLTHPSEEEEEEEEEEDFEEEKYPDDKSPSSGLNPAAPRETVTKWVVCSGGNHKLCFLLKVFFNPFIQSSGGGEFLYIQLWVYRIQVKCAKEIKSKRASLVE